MMFQEFCLYLSAAGQQMCWMEDALGSLQRLGRYLILTASYCRIPPGETIKLAFSPCNAVKTMRAMPRRTQNKWLWSTTKPS